jgi:hypothetical protein
MDEFRVIAGNREFDLDLDFIDGKVGQVAGDTAEIQRAYIASYTKKGTIPLQEDQGIDWAGFLQGEKPYNEIAYDLTGRIATYIGAGKYAPAFRQDGRMVRFNILVVK